MLDPNSANYWLQQSLINGEKALQQTIATGHAQDQAYRAEKNSQHVAENLNIAHHHIFQLKNELDEADWEAEDPNTKYYSHDEFKKMARRILDGEE